MGAFIGAAELDTFTGGICAGFRERNWSKRIKKKINNEEFYTTNGTAHEQGTGLGLMLCKEFLAKNDGHLRIESEIGKGSTFSFTPATVLVV